MIFLKAHLGFLFGVLHRCVQHTMDTALDSMELTAAQGRIMAHLAHSQRAPCPRDLEAEFHLSHPTVSGLLSRLEQKGFVELCTDPEDHRCKRIFLLPKGRQCQDLMHKTILENEQRIVEGFTPEEREQFSMFLHRAIRNMGGDPAPGRFKEEQDQ